MFLTIILSVLVGVIGVAYYFSTYTYDYWKKRNVPFDKPTPLFGNYGSIYTAKKHIAYASDDLYKKFPKEPLVGAFLGTVPALMIRDPEYVKLVTTKDFYFYNARPGAMKHADAEVFNRNIFFSNGDYWKTVRQNLSPVFSTAKMRTMFKLLADCAFEFEKLIDKEIETSDVLPAHLLLTRFTMACITSAAFGVDSNTMGQEYKTNPFTRAGDAIFEKSRSRVLDTYFKLTWPDLFYMLGKKSMPVQVTDMFHDFVTSVFKARNYKPTARNDFVDFILGFKEKKFIDGESLSHPTKGEAKKTSVEVTDEFLVANCLVFFVAGFETSATTLAYTLFELSKNPEVQKKVQQEIDEYLAKSGNKLEYSCLTEMPYMQACFDETLRLFPVLGLLQREVVDEVTIGSVRLDPGVQIHIPVYSLHRDPKYFPDPEEYRPERFLGENKNNIVPHSYIPFGDGPRLCLGMRFARMQMAAGVVTLMKKYKLDLAPETSKVPEFDPLSTLLPAPTKPLKIRLSLRDGWENRVFVQPEKNTCQS